MDEHSHADLWDYIDGLSEDLSQAFERIHALEHPEPSKPQAAASDPPGHTGLLAPE